MIHLAYPETFHSPFAAHINVSSTILNKFVALLLFTDLQVNQETPDHRQPALRKKSMMVKKIQDLLTQNRM